MQPPKLHQVTLGKRFHLRLCTKAAKFEADLLRASGYPSSRQLAKKLGLSYTAVANKLREYGINRKSVKI